MGIFGAQVGRWATSLGYSEVATDYYLLLLLTQFRQTLLGFGDVLGIGLVRGDFAVKLDGAGALLQMLVIEMSRPQARVELRVRVPLETALEVLSGPAVLLVGLAFVNVAE